MTESLSPVQRAFLNSIAAGESPGYDVIYGGQRFQDFTDHPRIAVPIKSGPNVGKTSSAAGRYQFLGSTWDEAKSALGLPDFSPDSQDRAAAWLAERDYKKRTGRGLWSDVEGAAGDPKKLDEIGSSLSGTWTSLPNGIERNRATSGFGQRVATELSAQSRNSSPIAWGAVAVEDSPSAWGAVPVEAGGGQSKPAEKGKAGFWDTYSGMVNESVDQFKTGVGQVKEAVVGDYAPATLLKGVGNVVAGGLGYAGAVPNAAIRTYGSQPLEDTTGIPKEVTELALAVTPWGPKRVPGAPSVRMAPSAPAAAVPRIPPVMPGQAVTGEQAIAAADRIGEVTGVPVNLPRAMTSDNIAVNQAGKTVANIPVAGTPLVRAAEEGLQNVDDAATALRRAYGGPDGKTDAATVAANSGAIAREAIRDYKSHPLHRRVEELYDAVDGHVNPAVLGPLTNTRRTADTIASNRTNSALGESRAVEFISEALSRPGMNYEGIKGLRSEFRAMKNDPRLIPEGMSPAEVNSIYNSLTQDMRLIIAKAGGTDGLRAWEKANNQAARWANVRESLNGILGAKTDAAIIDNIIKAAGSTSRADIRMLGRARGAVGAEKWDEVSAAVLETMIHPPGKPGFSFDTFATSYEKMSKAGREMLFRSKNHASHAEAIDAFYAISKRMKSHNKYMNPSGTGQTAMTGAGLLGYAVEPMSVIGGLVGGQVMARILAKPATARAAASYSRAYERAVNLGTPAAIQGYESASKLFAASVGTELSRSDMVPSLTRQLQQLVPSRAEQEPVNPEGERQ